MGREALSQALNFSEASSPLFPGQLTVTVRDSIACICQLDDLLPYGFRNGKPRMVGLMQKVP